MSTGLGSSNAVSTSQAGLAKLCAARLIRRGSKYDEHCLAIKNMNMCLGNVYTQ